MIGANKQITTYRMVRTGTTDAYDMDSPILVQEPVYILRTDEGETPDVDQAGFYEEYRLESSEQLDLQESDKVIDNNNLEYRVHFVYTFDSDEIGGNTKAILKRAHG